VSRYLEIEKMRFTHRLEAEVVCTITDTSIRVPSLLIQTLVDNGIKHGIARSAAGGVVTVHVALSAADPDHLTIEVSNTGAPLAPTRPQGPLSSGTGLANIEKRLRLLYGEDGSCTLESQPDGVTVARVVVPLGGQA
jgi:LytS/YehU family sensor histidine kinase